MTGLTTNPTILYDDPLVSLYEQVITPEECKYIIEIAKQHIIPAQSYGHGPERTSDYTWINHHYDLIFSNVCTRAAVLVDKQLNHAEPLQVATYQPGGQFIFHHDTYNVHREHGKIQVDSGGQRMFTAILYLNDVQVGGETTFDYLDLKFTPREGNILFFENCIRGTNVPNERSMHAGQPVGEGEKWIATLWFREKPQY
ncbi:prolyl 4-hydroxylase [Thermoactinomyces sp. DSM 45891]|uniref:prolyl hydroxylase family protein n=1 Tax=Thermoactinomyces sp. DSM 45891 TaxID=1761907 RepID=UPI00091F9AD2|nr:2OG-Fe(II) oxygenase [Thermoactinomyces sp. DSM 45891]SFX22004.1 prolyl 4-hydroxylase [Thermoactinomyces sp. DSM 45891]